MSWKKLGQVVLLFAAIIIASTASVPRASAQIPYHGCQPGGTCYYISYSTGSDSNDGLSETSSGGGHGPWKYPPFDQRATSTSAAHTPASTDEFILRGEVWPTPSGVLTTGYALWTISTGNGSSASGNNYPGMYIGYDPAWNDGTVKSVRTTYPGYHCSSAPKVVFANASGDTTGSGAAAKAYLGTQADANLGDVIGIVMTSYGSNYTANPTVSFTGSCTNLPAAVATIQAPVLDGTGTTFGTGEGRIEMLQDYHADYLTLDGLEFRHFRWDSSYDQANGQVMVDLGDTNGHLTVQGSYFHDFGQSNPDTICNDACGSDDSQTKMLSMPGNAGDTVTGNWFGNYEAMTLGTWSNGCRTTGGHTSANQCSQGVGLAGGAVVTNNYIWDLRGELYWGTAPTVGIQISGNYLFDGAYDAAGQHGDIMYGQADGAIYNNRIWDNPAGSATNYIETSVKSTPTDYGFTTYIFNNVCWNDGEYGSACPNFTTENYPFTVTSMSPVSNMHVINNTNSLAGYGGGGGACVEAGQWFGDSANLVRGISPAKGAYPFSIEVKNNFCMLATGGVLANDSGAVNGSVKCPTGTNGQPQCGTWNGVLGGSTASTMTAANQITQISSATAQGYTAANQYQPTAGTNDTVTFASRDNSTNYTGLCSKSVAGVSLAPLCFDINGNPRPASGSWQAGAYVYGGSSASAPAAPTDLTAFVQ